MTTDNTTQEPKQGDLRVWCNVNMSNTRFYPVPSVEYAKDFIERLANEQLSSDAIVTNSFGLEVYDPDELDVDGNPYGWVDWLDDEGEDICDTELVAPLLSISFKPKS
jgi:hypothetical protein